jgi:hypothetical protein
MRSTRLEPVALNDPHRDDESLIIVMRIMVVCFAIAKLTTCHSTMGPLVDDMLPHGAMTAAAKIHFIAASTFSARVPRFCRIRIHEKSTTKILTFL